ncbi:MAG: MotA/TolQ/ExbB proton channel family protein [Candidatus Eiseniibacteriota bacterium]
MANTSVHAVIHKEAAHQAYPAAKSSAAKIVARLRTDLATPQALDGVEAPETQLAFLSRFVVLQTIGAALIAALWIAGLAQKPFEGTTAPLCWIILGIGALGIVCVFLRRWHDAQWIAIHVVRIGLLGTVVGLIIAFSAAASGGSSNPDEIRPMIAAVVSGMYVSLYATLLGIATNLWLKINLRLLGNFHG